MRGSALDLALERERIDGAADVLCRPDPDDPGQPELDVHLGDDPHGGAGEGDVGTLAGDLPRLGIERRRARVPVDALDVDLAAARRSRSSSAARQASRTAPAAIQVIRDADAEPADPDGRRRVRHQP